MDSSHFNINHKNLFLQEESEIIIEFIDLGIITIHQNY